MKGICLMACCVFYFCTIGSAQVDLKRFDINNIGLKDIIGKVMHVQKGFAPKFFLQDLQISQIPKVAEILGLKKNGQINKLFNTFRTGRTIYKIASYAGSVAAVYGVVRKVGNNTGGANGSSALTSGLITVGSGLAVKFLTKAASYKAVEIFNGIAVKKIRDIFSIKPASSVMGMGLYVKLT